MEICKLSEEKSSITQLLTKNSTFSNTDEEASEVLSEQYYNTFTQEDCSSIPDIEDKLFSEALNNFKIQESAVRKALKNLKVDKSPGIDELHPRILKEMADVLSTPLTLIFQATLDSSELPRQ